MEAPMTAAPLFDRLLRDGRPLSQELLTAPGVAARIGPLAAIAAGGAAVFGLALGIQGGAVQALVSAVKLPLIVLGAAGISLPVLHVAQALFGKPVAPERLSALVLQAVGTATVTMAGLVPLAVITWLTFAAGAGPDSPELWVAYRRLVLATVAVGALGGLVGAARLRHAVSVRALLPWSAVLGLAGLQLTWLMRPVIGMPGREVLFRPLESNAVAEVLKALAAVLGG